MEDFNKYQRAIETLVSNGFIIVQILNPDGSSSYFLSNKFEESFSSDVQSVDFNRVEGINITNFMRVNGSQVDQNNLIARFNEVIERSPIIRCEFSKNVVWFKYGLVAK